MAKIREKASAIPMLTKEQAQDTLGEYTEATTELESISAEMDQRITEIRNEYSDKIAALTSKKDEKFKALQLYATQNKDNLFADDKRSIDLVHGKIGFRWGNFKVVTLKSVTIKAAVQLMAKNKFLRENFLVPKVDLNKEAIIAVRDDKKKMDKIRAVGLDVDQEESFFVELNKEEVAA